MAKSNEPRKEPTRRRTTTPRTRTKGGAEAAPPATAADETANPARETSVPAAASLPESPSGLESTVAPTGAAATSRRDGTPSYEAIARRAYEIYRSRGGENGRAVEDWLRAERELRE